ncbi:hypothetical protein LG200_05170 [Methylobacillus caricis]|uniref:hypothetical protein n=1 Tax=Methylobacillus caricis TaxID=1971611 RepID=UPI001CFFBE41|nr:hypothetical protein [Methylobacillus caricis]MCB5187395.1 hypothetical protein [Methylobacillus caricis]
MKPVPPAVARRGLNEVRDNLQPGDALDVTSFFLRIFRSDIEAKLKQEPIPCADHAAGIKSDCRLK